MKIDQYGRVTISEKEALDTIYSGNLTNNIILDQNYQIDQFNRSVDKNKDKISKLKFIEDLGNTSIESFDKLNQSNWFVPKDAVQENLIEMLYGMCETEEQRKRVDEELELFIQHGMFDLLFYLKYLVDTMRENNIVWGVGRGSSVASYVLFLIGIHKIDSIKYELDIHEFLK